MLELKMVDNKPYKKQVIDHKPFLRSIYVERMKLTMAFQMTCTTEYLQGLPKAQAIGDNLS